MCLSKSLIRCVIGTLVFLTASFSPTHAQAFDTCIDFNFPKGTIITDQYASKGVIFSGSNGAPFINEVGFLSPKGSMTATFVSPSMPSIRTSVDNTLIFLFSNPVRISWFSVDSQPIGSRILDLNDVSDPFSIIESIGGFTVEPINPKSECGIFGICFNPCTPEVTPRIEITLEPQPENNIYIIDSVPTMPKIQARAKVVGICPDTITPTTDFTWNVELTLKTGANESNYSKDIEQNVVTKGDNLFTLRFLDPTVFRGGKLKLTAKTTVNQKELTVSTPDGLMIQGTNPQRHDIQAGIDQAITGQFTSLADIDVQDAIKRIACQEFGQRQFDALGDGGIGSPKISDDGGIGLFQITATTNCLRPSLMTCPHVVFNWQANMQEGISAFREKIKPSKDYPSNLRNRKNKEYKAFIRNINLARKSAKLKPIEGMPAPDFTASGILGADQTNQLLEDCVRGFNGFGEKRMFRYPLHEFMPDMDFLKSASNEALSTLDQNSRVWRRVRSDERGTAGDADYINHVKAHLPECR